MRYRRLVSLVVALTLTFAGSAGAALPEHFWSKKLGSTGADAVTSIAVDSYGNILVTGYFQGTVDFGGSGLLSAGGNDIFLAKYSASGAHLWSQRFGGTGSDTPLDVAVDASGNVVITGGFAASVDFGGGTLVSPGSQTNIFVAKYDANGAHLWSKAFGINNPDYGRSVACDPTGNVVVSGYFFETVDFGGGPRMSAGFDDVFLVKYNASGVHQWSQRFGGTNSDGGHALAIDASGNIVLTGRFNGTVNFGGGPLVSSNYDGFLAKYNTGGVHQWSKRLGGTSPNDAGEAVAIDASGFVVASGHFTGTASFGGAALASAGLEDIFLARYDANGVYQWSQRFGSTDADMGYDLAADASGNVLVTGTFVGTVSFGGAALVGAGYDDIFFARYDASGVHQWSQRFGGSFPDYGRSVAVHPSGNVLVAGSFQNTADFGGGAVASAGGNDGFIAQYMAASLPPIISSVLDVGNDQGRQVVVEFAPSALDQLGSWRPILQYEAFRRIDPLATLSSSPPDGMSVPMSDALLLAEDWTFVAGVPAHGDSVYTVVVPTLADSTVADGMRYSAFFVRAATADPYVYYDSPADSGYSLDNLAPGVPTALSYSAGVLNWDDSPAADFDYFTVYGSGTDSFGGAVVIGYTVAPELDVTDSPYAFYFVTATDFSGNEGGPASLNTPTGVGEAPHSYVLSISSFPNPFNPTTTIRYTVPSRGRVKVDVYNTRGEQVATVVDEEVEAGAYRRAWNGRDSAGRTASSGVYFARVSHATGTRSYKMVLLK